MPPQRTLLRSISSNARRGPDISPYMRGKIVRAANCGALVSEIRAEYRLSRNAVRGSIAQDKSRPEGESAPRPGCPKTYIDRDKRIMLRNLRLYPKATFDKRQKECNTKMSNSMIKRIA
jgi:hypothetical protein